MKKTILAITGSALIALSTLQCAVASERHDQAHHRATGESRDSRDSNAFLAPVYESAPETYRSSGGWSAPAGR